MYIGINFVTKKVISILFALALFSCRPLVNQPTSKSSASDSVELKKQEAWESVHRLDSVETLLAEEKKEYDAEASASDKPARQYSEHELNAIMDTIGQRLSKCKELSSCISSYCVVANGIEVNFIYNTAERRRLFRQKVYNAPILKFVGPESPIRMSKTGVSDTLGISIRPTKEVFPLIAETVTFILRNNSCSELTCGEHCEIAFLDSEGVWRKLPRNEMFNDIGYEVRPNGSRTVSGRLNPKAFPTPATRYRFFYPIKHNGTNITLMAEYEMR